MVRDGGETEVVPCVDGLHGCTEATERNPMDGQDNDSQYVLHSACWCILFHPYDLRQGCPNRGPPGCVMRSAAAFVNYICYKITQ
jgi:hypothetical protein